MGDNEVTLITYSSDHREIVKSGVEAISKVLNSSDLSEKRSLLFCLDYYLDPYYGYKLPHNDDILDILQKQLFIEEDRAVKEDILELLSMYSNKSLDYLAENIALVEYELLADAIHALSNTYNLKYVPIFINHENHDNPEVRNNAKEALIELSKLNTKEQTNE